MNPFASIKELKSALERKEVSIPEVLQFYTQRLKKFNPTLNCALEIFDDVDEKKVKNPTGPLGGIPCLIKDLICQKGRITSAASKILSTYKAPYDATVMERLNNDGAVSLGRGNMDEFAMGASGEFSAYGPTKNPWDTTRVSGGSSAGPAAAVSAGLVPFALGSETGGSIRNPAAFCNLVGLYPTYGLNSRYGVIAFASSADQVGPLTRTVYDNALVLSSTAGADTHDTTTKQVARTDYTKDLDGKLPKDLKIGIIKDAIDGKGIDPEVNTAFNNAIDQLKKLGATVQIIDLPNMKYGIALYFIISRAEAASNLYRYDGSLYGVRNKEATDLFDMYLKSRHDGLGTEVKRRILTGNYVLSAGHKDAYYNKAQKMRGMVLAEFDAAFKSVDVLVSPTITTPAFKIGEVSNDPLAMYLADYFTVANCIIGTPALALPCGLTKNNLPISFQILGPSLSEALLYKVGHAYQMVTDHHLKTPKDFA